MLQATLEYVSMRLTWTVATMRGERSRKTQLHKPEFTFGNNTGVIDFEIILIQTPICDGICVS